MVKSSKIENKAAIFEEIKGINMYGGFLDEQRLWLNNKIDRMQEEIQEYKSQNRELLYKNLELWVNQQNKEAKMMIYQCIQYLAYKLLKKV